MVLCVCVFLTSPPRNNQKLIAERLLCMIMAKDPSRLMMLLYVNHLLANLQPSYPDFFFSKKIPDVAQQLTAFEYHLFTQITRDEVLGLKWSKPGKNERAKNVLRYINHFNRLSSWVVREIITKYAPIINEARFSPHNPSLGSTSSNVLKFFCALCSLHSSFASTTTFHRPCASSLHLSPALSVVLSKPGPSCLQSGSNE